MIGKPGHVTAGERGLGRNQRLNDYVPAPANHPTRAITSISTSTSFGSPATATVARAGL